MEFKDVLKQKMLFSEAKPAFPPLKAPHFPSEPKILEELFSNNMRKTYSWPLGKYPQPPRKKTVSTYILSWNFMNAADKKAAKTLRIPSETDLSIEVIREFHRKQAIKTHPDLNPNLDSQAFIESQNSYEQLLSSFEKHKVLEEVPI